MRAGGEESGLRRSVWADVMWHNVNTTCMATCVAVDAAEVC